MRVVAKSTFKVLLATACIVMTSCNAEDDKVFAGGSAETKPNTTLLDGVELGGDATEITKVASATFLINVLSESEAEMCAGEVSAEIMSNLTVKLPSGLIKCASLEIDLTKVLGGAALGGEAGGGEPGDKIKMIEHDGKVLLLKEIMGARFDPPRPMLIGPIIQDSSKYEGYDETFQTTLTGIGANEGTSGNGSFNVKVIDAKTTYYNKAVDEQFENVIHWTMTKKGFDGVPATVGALFDSFEFYWNTRPIMIPKVIVKGKLGDLIKSNDPGATDTTNDLVGVLTISLTIKEYDFDGE